MKKKPHLFSWLFAFCVLTLVGIIMADEIQKVPVVVMPSMDSREELNRVEKKKIENLVRRYFHLDDPDTRYGEVRIEVTKDKKEKLRFLMVHLIYREIYLVDVVKLSIDDRYRVTEVDRSPY